VGVRLPVSDRSLAPSTAQACYLCEPGVTRHDDRAPCATRRQVSPHPLRRHRPRSDQHPRGAAGDHEC